MKKPTQIVLEAVEWDSLKHHEGVIPLRPLPRKWVRFLLEGGLRIEVLPNPSGGIDIRGVDGLPLIVEMNAANVFNVRVKEME